MKFLSTITTEITIRTTIVNFKFQNIYLFLLVFIIFNFSENGVKGADGRTNQQCYKCTSTIQNYENVTRLCSKFDHSSAFIVSCPYSTMCVKRIYQHPLLSGELITLEDRDCADQGYVYQDLVNRNKWVEKKKILEIYNEGCQILNDKGLRSAKTEYCYCRGNLCNTATKQQTSQLPYHTDTVGVIIVFNLIKYIQSL